MLVNKQLRKVIELTFLEIVSPVAKQHRHLRSENPSLNPATKLDAGISPYVHITAP